MKIESYEQAMHFVQQDGLALEFVPEQLKTAELCIIAMLQNPSAHVFIPNNIKLEIPT